VLGRVFGWIGALAIIVGGIYALIVAIRSGSAGSVALLAGVFTVAAALVARYYERRRAMETVRREELGPFYLEMASVLIGHELPGGAEREELLTGFLRKSLLYASPETLEAFRAWRVGLPVVDREWTPREEYENSLLYEAFVKAMRSDLGISNWNLQDGDLARTIRPEFDDLANES
jgi:hypothetical protein